MLIRDALGQFVPLGKVPVVREADGFDGTMPSLLTVPSGTSSITGPAAGVPSIRATTVSGVGNTAEIRFAAQVDTGSLRGLVWTVERIKHDTADSGAFDIVMGIEGTNCGGRLSRGASEQTGSMGGSTLTALRASGDGGNLIQSNMPVSLRQGEASNFSLVLVRDYDGSGELVVLSDDQVICGMMVPAASPGVATWTTGVVTPYIKITNVSTGPHYVQVSKARLTAFYD